MTSKFSKILTGFSFLDNKWGGVYPGGNYLIYGSVKSGKTLLALKIIEQFVQNNQNTLFLTNDRKKNLEIQANSLYFDINEATAGGTLKVQKIEKDITDLSEIENLVKENNPSILVIDEIINGNNTFGTKDYLNLLQYLEDNEITTFFIASIPDSDDAKKLLKIIAKNSTGIIYLKKSPGKRNYSGMITIKPNVGHFEGEFETSYKVEPVKGFVTLADNESAILGIFSENKLLLEKPEVEHNFNYSNVYSPEEFKIFLDSKLAMSEATGENISIIKYETKDNSIEPVEICNSIKKVLSDGDKICFTDKSLYLLPENNDNDYLKKLSAKLDDRIKESFAELGDLENLIIRTKQILKSNFKII